LHSRHIFAGAGAWRQANSGANAVLFGKQTTAAEGRRKPNFGPKENHNKNVTCANRAGVADSTK
jgi:hypothetical protein